MERARLLFGHTVVLAAALLFGTIDPGSARAQFTELTTLDTVTEGQRANFFLSWQSDQRIDGFYVDLPSGWRLEEVQIIGRSESSMPEASIDEAAVPSERGKYRVAADPALQGSYHTIFRIRVGERTGDFSWEVAPYLEVETGDSLLTEERYAAAVAVEQEFILDEQFAVRLDRRVADRPGLLVDSDRLTIGVDESFTTEFWMKTVDLNQVVLSTWDGRERSTYPIEVMVDARGYVTCYRGVGGLHHSLISSRPVADGAWHHVAVAHSRRDGWTRLMIDGVSVDSLHIASESSAQDRRSVILGGRPLPRYASAVIDPPEFNFTGTLDEIRIWRKSRTERQIQNAMYRQIENSREGLVRVGFDESDVEERFFGGTESMQFILSELSLFDPIERVNVEKQANGVEVRWEAVPAYSEAFMVERSMDGQYFEQVAHVPAGPSGEDDLQRSRRYSVTDPTVREGVVYYRVRQIISDEERRPVAKTLKVGLRSSPRNTANLLGNFPNPFNSTTLIKYELHETQHVRLEIWDMSGHRRAALVDATQDAGLHDVRFDASNLPSGAYVIRLETARAAQTHAMILMK